MQGMTMGLEASQKAVELDGNIAETHMSRASALTMAWRWKEAEQEFHRSLELNPNSATTQYFYAMTYLIAQKRMDEALEHFHIALSLDPLSPIVNTNLAMLLMDMHRYAESKEQFEKTLARDPNFIPANLKFAAFCASQGDYACAVDHLMKWPVIKTDAVPTRDAKGYFKLLMPLESQEEWGPYLAGVYAVTGNKDKAFEYLEKAYATHNIELILSIRYPIFDSLRSDPRYADLMRRIGLPE
jgi:tetratricopeptide (TPR) repeat protein